MPHFDIRYMASSQNFYVECNLCKVVWLGGVASGGLQKKMKTIITHLQGCYSFLKPKTFVT